MPYTYTLDWTHSWTFDKNDYQTYDMEGTTKALKDVNLPVEAKMEIMELVDVVLEEVRRKLKEISDRYRSCLQALLGGLPGEAAKEEGEKFLLA